MKKMRNRSRKNKKQNKLIINVLFILCALFIWNLFTNFKLANKQLVTEQIVVQDSDTIWKLARDICKDNTDLYIENVIIEIKEINNLSSSNIYTGQILKLPVY